jgi:hypothetical protein
MNQFTPTPMLLTDAECDALADQFRAKADELHAAGDPAWVIWDQAQQALHDARLESFSKRAEARRRRHRKALARL